MKSDSKGVVVSWGFIFCSICFFLDNSASILVSLFAYMFIGLVLNGFISFLLMLTVVSLLGLAFTVDNF